MMNVKLWLKGIAAFCSRTERRRQSKENSSPEELEEKILN